MASGSLGLEAVGSVGSRNRGDDRHNNNHQPPDSTDDTDNRRRTIRVSFSDLKSHPGKVSLESLPACVAQSRSSPAGVGRLPPGFPFKLLLRP
jgi:hypothetical protein